MSLSTENLLQAYALLAAEPELFRAVEEIHLHFVGEELCALPALHLPGVVLRWLNCYADLELWHEAFRDQPAPADLERALDLAARMEQLGVEPDGERACHDCDYRNRCL